MRERTAPIDLARFGYWVRVDVRYSDLDTLGVVNNATYFTYFEHARVAFFEHLRAEASQGDESDGTAETDTTGGQHEQERAVGYAAAEMPFVLARATCAYRRPISSLAPVQVGVRCTLAGRATIEMEYVICDRRGLGATLYASGATTAVCVDMRTGKPRSLPEWARLALARGTVGDRGSQEPAHGAEG